jgi:hypothetical protein
MKNNTTLYHFIVDCSGSMYDCIDDTIGGFNAQLNSIEELKSECPDQKFLTSVTLFNTEIDHVVTMERQIGESKLNRKNYVPSGGTALLDAVGVSVQRIERVMGQEIEEDRASVVVVIMTDGHENSSRMFNYKEVSKMISRLSNTGKWTFNFLGADLDSFDTVDNLSIPRGNALMFFKGEMSDTMEELSGAVKNYAHRKSEGNVKSSLF